MGAGTAWADDVTFTATKDGFIESPSSSGISIATSVGFDQSNGYNKIAEKATIKVTPSTGKTITKVVFTHTSSNSSHCTSWKLGDINNDAAEEVTFDGLNETSECTFTAGGSARLKSVTITYTTSSDPAPITHFQAPTITINGNWMTVSQLEGQGATMFWKYTLTKVGDISNDNKDNDGTTDNSKGFFIPYGHYPADFIQAQCVDMSHPLLSDPESRTSEITKYGNEIYVNPPSPTAVMSGTNKVLFTMQGQTASCYFEYQIGEGDIVKVYEKTSHEIDITSNDKITVWTTASYDYKETAEGEVMTGYLQSSHVEFTPTYTPDVVFEITTQPESKTYNYKATATALSVVAVSENDLTYQWYSNTDDDNTNGTIIEGATEASYTPSTEAVGTTYYYCVVTEGTTNATLTSNTAKIDVIVPKPSVGVHENIVTISGPVAGAKYYYTLDKSDPTTSASRIEYAPDAVAIRENITKIRAVAYIDGIYSGIQGVDVTYEPVTVLEAREKVNANETFTGNTCTTNRSFTNEAKASDGWTNTKSPNSFIDVDEKIYRGQTDKNQIIIGLNSTSAKKFVIGFVSNASDSRSFSNLSVDGSVVGCTNNGQTNSSKTDVKRLVITPNSEIEQGSEVTFTFNGNVNITYIEVFGTSLEQCEAPEIVPYEYDETNGWSYQIIPATGTTVNYTIAGGATQTSTTVVTVSASDITADQVIKAWSTKDGMGGSERVTMTDASTIAPVIRFAPSASATYNKATTSWVGGEAPKLEIFPSSLLKSVTYTTLDPTVGNGVDGYEYITLGTGQGVTTITASVTVSGIAGLVDGTYTKELTLALSDGFEDKLPKNYTPQVGGTRQVKDDSGNVILTLGFGGWTHGSNGSTWYADGNGATEDKTKTKNADKWPTTSDFTGDGDSPATKIDGYIWQSQAETDARSETKGNIVWETQYQKVKPYSLPCRGAYITVTPEKNGKLTIYLVQNGCINETGSDKGTISGAPRTYYWFDNEGNCIPADAVTVTQPIYFTPTSTLNGKDPFKDQVKAKWGVDINDESASTNSELYTALKNHWADLQSTDIEHPVPYRGGYFLMKKAYIKYVVTLLAGKTYYFFSNGSKMGYSGLNFAPADEVSIKLPQGGTQTVSTVASLDLDDTQDFTAPSSTTAYKKVTLNRTFKAGVWNTICLPISVSKEQVERVFGKGTVFVGYNGFSDNTLHLVYHAYDYLLPGQPYFIKPTGDGVELNDGVIENIVFNGVTVTSNAAVKDNDGKNDDFVFVGLFNGKQLNTYDHYMNGSGNIVFSSTKSVALKGYRAYLKNNTGSAAQVKAIAYANFDDDMDEPTSIDGLIEYLESEGVKVVPAGGVYNLSGQKVADDATNIPAGIYIINGKKVVIK